MSARASHDDAAKHAALYVLFCLPRQEAREFEEHLAACPACEGEVRQLKVVASALALLVPTADPPSELRAKLLDRVASLAGGPAANESAAETRPAQGWRKWALSLATGGPIFVPAGEPGWEPTGVAGVSAQGLLVDPANDRMTLLVRMESGATYPSHRRGGPEERYLLEGDLSDGEFHMHAGDSLRRDGGSIHGTHFTRQGCVMLITSSLHDELIFEARRCSTRSGTGCRG